MTLPRLASRLAEKWALYLEFLRASLEHEPDGEQAWRWEIKARVLTYLLARYGNDPRAGVNPPQRCPDSPATPPLQRTFVPPRPRESFTQRLQAIAEANDVPPEEQSRLAEDLNRRSPPTQPTRPGERRLTLAVFLWLLLSFATSAYVAMILTSQDQSIVLHLVAALSVWAVGFALWFIRR